MSFEQFDLNCVEKKLLHVQGNLFLSDSISVLPGLKIILSDEHLALMSDKKTSKLGEEYIMSFIKTEMRKRLLRKEHFCCSPIFLYLLHVIDFIANAT